MAGALRMVVHLLLMLLTTTIISSGIWTSQALTFNVLDFGASDGGKIDNVEAFQSAWMAACMTEEPSAVYIPKGRYLIGYVQFTGPCKSPWVKFLIDGTLAALPRMALSKTWIEFNSVDGVSIMGGGGLLDGRGAGLWKCKISARSSGSKCPNGPPSLSIIRSSRVIVTDLHSVDPKFSHIFIFRSRLVSVRGGKLLAPKDSPNTDGIHVQMSSSVNILGTTIRTGDDCISIGPGTTDLLAENIACGPGHGISIGSLGWMMEENGVEKVKVRNVTLVETQNGVRIKTWAKPSTGFVKDIIFQDIVMHDVRNPIFIDQNYCPGVKGCPNQLSGVQISKVTYHHVIGTSASKVAVNLNCSASHPCSDIQLDDINLTYENRHALSSCKHAIGTSSHISTPPSCLRPVS